MTMASKLQQYLNDAGVQYELLPHAPSHNSADSARNASIPESQLAKAVVLEDDDGYLVAVLPASRKVELKRVRESCGRPLALASEKELDALFGDCKNGAIPALGQAYGLTVLCDNSLDSCDDVYFEAGDHTDLVHVTGSDFRHLMSSAPHASISQTL